jgi:alpha-mannosidase
LIFSYAMNNYWMTNFKASQGERDSSVRDHFAGGSDPARPTVRLEWSASSRPPDPAIEGDGHRGPRSFLEVDSPSVIVQAIKRAEDGTGLIVRLRETAGRPAEARLKSVLLEGAGVAAELVDTEWADGEPVGIRDGEAVVSVPAFGIRTLKIILGP